MTEMLPPSSMSLFDLLGRSWRLDSEINKVLFSSDMSTLAALSMDGQLAFFPVDDPEAPDKRIRLEIETGRMTIRPREKPVSPPIYSNGADACVAVADPIHAIGPHGFAFIHASGTEIWRATPRGQTLRLSPKGGQPITAIGYHAPNDVLVLGRGTEVSLVAAAEFQTIASQDLGHAVERILISSGSSMIACWGAGAVSILSFDGLEVQKTVVVEGDALDLAWSPDGRWLAAGCQQNALALVDISAGEADRIVDFPAAARTVGFSKTANTLVASGAFRVVGWQLPDLPFGTHEGSSVETGKPGLIIVETVTCHPDRDLCAVGYANGLVTVCQIGGRDEMMLREGGGGPITSLAWSNDGKHLAIGSEDGAVALATLPKTMLK